MSHLHRQVDGQSQFLSATRVRSARHRRHGWDFTPPDCGRPASSSLSLRSTLSGCGLDPAGPRAFGGGCVMPHMLLGQKSRRVPAKD